MHLTFTTKHAVDTFTDYFCELESNGAIRPEYVTEKTFRFHFNEYSASKRMSALIDDTDGIVKSIMFYDQLTFPDSDSLDGFVSFYLGFKSLKASALEGFREYGYQRDAVYVQLIESFEKEKGYGTALIRSLQDDANVEFIFLDPLAQAVPFYFANGFYAIDVRSEAYKTGIFCWNQNRLRE